jgi:TATA-binding protein-associated factor
VLELWSLFDFLMPGFLGTEKQFTARYSKPILASRDPKSSAKEQEAGLSVHVTCSLRLISAGK